MNRSARATSPLQVEQCYLNLGTALAEVGASFDDVAKLTVYLVDWAPDKMEYWIDGVQRASAQLGITADPAAHRHRRRGPG